MKKIIYGVLLAFAFSLLSVGAADWLLRQEAASQGQSSYLTHDVGLPEPTRVPPPPPPR